MNKTISFSINGVEKSFSFSPNEKLLDVLRRNNYKGTKWGCGEGSCGACTVIIDGKAVLACTTYAFLAEGRDVWTIEGVGSSSKPHLIQQTLIDAGAVQCGYCIPGIVMSAKALFDKKPTADNETIKENIDGNLCRCTGYEKIYKAMQQVSESNSTQR